MDPTRNVTNNVTADDIIMIALLVARYRGQYLSDDEAHLYQEAQRETVARMERSGRILTPSETY